MAPRQRSPIRPSSSDVDVAASLTSVNAIETKPLVCGDISKLRDEFVAGSTARKTRDGQEGRRQHSDGDRRSGRQSNVGNKKIDGNFLTRDRDHHDVFNLVALPSVIALTLANYDWEKVQEGMGPEGSWTDEYFVPYWAVTMLYFFVDLIWVKLVPTCVKSPDVIIKHHMVAMFYLIGPIFFAEFRWCMGACLSVEVNTWFLIARRVAYLRKDVVPAIVMEGITFLFYVSWVAIRCVLYPFIMTVYLRKAHEALIETGTLMHWPVVFVPIHFILCLLNLKWSLDLFSPIVHGWFSWGVEKAGGVSDGL